MADNVTVTVATAGARSAVAAEDIGSVQFQRVKLVGGQLGSTEPIPGDSTKGLMVQWSTAMPVTGTFVAAAATTFISGTVQVSGPVTITPTVLTVNTAATVAGASVTIQQGASVSAQVSGAVSISNVAPVTTAASVSVSGLPVWLNPTQQINASATSAAPLWVTGTVAAGAGTTVVSIGGVVPVTTAASVSVSGLPVWLNPTQQVVVSGLVGHSVTGSVNIVSTAIVSLATGGTLATLLGTLAVSQVGGTTAPPSISATGQPFWVAGGQSTTANPVFVSGSVAVSGSVVVSGAIIATTTQAAVTGANVWLAPTQTIALVSTLGTVLGTVAVNVVAGGAGGGSVTTAAPSISATGQAVWIVGGQGTTANPVVITGTVVAGAGTTAVSLSGVVVTTTAVSGVGGPIVWLGASQSILASISVSVSVSVSLTGAAIATTTQAGATGAIVWFAPTQTIAPIQISTSQVLGTIVAVSGVTAISNLSTVVTVLGTVQVSVAQPVFCQLAVSLTAAAATGSTMLFTAYTGASQIVAGTSAWPVPAGKALRVNRIEGAFVSSAAGAFPTVYIVGATAAASLTLGGLATLPVYAVLVATSAVLGTSFYSAGPFLGIIPAGVTVGVLYTMNTSGTIAVVRVYGELN